MRNLLGGSAILETCLAKVNGKSVNVELEMIEHQYFTNGVTFAFVRDVRQNLPS
jgi:hypothetical protein